jgi:hypothetical protein
MNISMRRTLVTNGVILGLLFTFCAVITSGQELDPIRKNCQYDLPLRELLQALNATLSLFPQENITCQDDAPGNVQT